MIVTPTTPVQIWEVDVISLLDPVFVADNKTYIETATWSAVNSYIVDRKLVLPSFRFYQKPLIFLVLITFNGPHIMSPCYNRQTFQKEYGSVPERNLAERQIWLTLAIQTLKEKGLRNRGILKDLNNLKNKHLTIPGD